MEEGKKKIILTAIAIVCLVLAGTIVVMRSGSEKSGIEGIQRGTLTWVKCNNPDCNAEYEMDVKDYFDEYKKAVAPSPTELAPLTCKKCGQQSVYKGEKCTKCGKVFYPATVRGDYPDRCTYCNYSVMEAKKKAKGG